MFQNLRWQSLIVNDSWNDLVYIDIIVINVVINWIKKIILKK